MSCLVVLTCGTSHTSIFTMASWAEVICPNSLTGRPWTVDKSCLRTSTQQVIKKDGASATAKVSIGVCYCTYGCTVKTSSQCTLNLEHLVYWDMLSIRTSCSVCIHSHTYIMYCSVPHICPPLPLHFYRKVLLRYFYPAHKPPTPPSRRRLIPQSKY